ncbi:hypothetical protein ACFWPV_10120 [Streptomyces uncialis]|uniref:hypothetical protein n=1 Tax=Streptomyces uncialis TaxID=1048205 RepID=UPI003651C84C
MTGPEHYREAERLLTMAHHWTDGDGGDTELGAALAAEAQAHATLALAAATARQAPVGGDEIGMSRTEWYAWYAAAGTQHGKADG